jgi:hydrogenase maturation protease
MKDIRGGWGLVHFSATEPESYEQPLSENMDLSPSFPPRERLLKDILVLGIGSPLCGDDGFGVEVVRRLREQEELPSVEFLDGGTSGLYLLPHLEGRSHVLVVDAIDFGGLPGQFVQLRAADIPADGGLKLSQHQVTFQEVVALMDLLELKPQELLFVGIQPRSIHWGDPLSPEAEAAIPRVIEEIRKQLASWGSAACAVDS